jgi:hypothetical protein
MLHKTALALLLSVVVSQYAVAGALRFTLAPVDSASSARADSASSAHGTFHIVNGKPTDTVCRFRLSIAGLDPGAPYSLQVHVPGGTPWILGVWTDQDGSCTTMGTTDSQIMSATEVELVDGMDPDFVILRGDSR